MDERVRDRLVTDMPLVPVGLSDGLLSRVRERVERELGRPVEYVKEKVRGPVERVKQELGLAPLRRPPPSGPAEILMRAREATRQDPPRLVYALYQAKDADHPTWRHLAPYSIRDRKAGGGSLLYAACEKEGWAVEAFDLGRFKDFQITTKPWPFTPKFRIEFRDGD